MLWSEKRADWRWKREGEGFWWVDGRLVEEDTDTLCVLCVEYIYICVCESVFVRVLRACLKIEKSLIVRMAAPKCATFWHKI